jgi:OFA family oxalate/formate antiporter-like MFS transporter
MAKGQAIFDKLRWEGQGAPRLAPLSFLGAAVLSRGAMRPGIAKMVELAKVKPMPAEKIPQKAWVVVLAAIAINLCLGILYAWSVWVKTLINVADAGKIIATGPAAGWTYLTNAQAATPFSVCVIVFALCMIPGGRIHDRLGPKVGPSSGGVCLALGCLLAGWSKSYGGLLLGFGVLGGIGLGLAYASTTPAALQWFGPNRRGLVAGLVLSGYAGAALYVSPLAAYLVQAGGVTFSIISLGIFCAAVVILAGNLLSWPAPGYAPPAAPASPGGAPAHAVETGGDWAPGQMLKTWQFYVLILMFSGAIQAGLTIITHAAPLLAKTGKAVHFLGAHAWILFSFGVLVNISGKIGTGKYSDSRGRDKALSLNCLAGALCLFFLPGIIASQNLFLLLMAVGLGYWLHEGTLALVPAYAADFYGTKNLGMNYVLLSVGGWPLGFLVSRLSRPLRAWTGSLTWVFIFSAMVLIAVVILARVTKRPAV